MHIKVSYPEPEYTIISCRDSDVSDFLNTHSGVWVSGSPAFRVVAPSNWPRWVYNNNVIDTFSWRVEGFNGLFLSLDFSCTLLLLYP